MVQANHSLEPHSSSAIRLVPAFRNHTMAVTRIGWTWLSSCEFGIYYLVHPWKRLGYHQSFNEIIIRSIYQLTKASFSRSVYINTSPASPASPAPGKCI